MRLILTLLATTFLFNNLVMAADEPAATLLIDHQKFSPSQLSVAAGIKTKIVIRNQDTMPIEFESYDLSREIVVPRHGEVTIYIGPLESGSYQFFNDFDHDMQGSVIVKPGKGN